jgi:hypothetical protein
VASIAEGPKLDHSEGRSLSPEQAKIFLRAVKGHRHEGAYVIALSLAFVAARYSGLSWNDIEASEGTSCFTFVANSFATSRVCNWSTSRRWAAGECSTSHVRWWKYSSAIALARKRKNWSSASGGTTSDELIFTSNIGTPLDPESFGRTVPKICKDAGLGHWSIHELRHSCASLLIAMEVPLEAVAEQLGHASIRVTKDVYGHLMPRSRARAAEAMRTILYDDVSGRFSRNVQSIGYIIGYIGVREDLISTL